MVGAWAPKVAYTLPIKGQLKKLTAATIPTVFNISSRFYKYLLNPKYANH